jgi:hypothetical protein
MRALARISPSLPRHMAARWRGHAAQDSLRRDNQLSAMASCSAQRTGDACGCAMLRQLIESMMGARHRTRDSVLNTKTPPL